MSTVDQLPGWWKYLYKSPPTLEGESGIWRAQISFVTTQDNVIGFVSTIEGAPTAITTSWGTMTRWIPLVHPIYSGLYAKRVRVEMFGTPSATSDALQDLHSHARVIVDFESYPFGVEGDQAFMALSIKGGGVYTSIPGRKMTFSNGETLGADAGYFDSQIVYSLTLFQCATLNDTTLNAQVQTINNATFLNQPANQMRFDTWSADYQVTSGGVLTYTKQLQFTYQSHSWNEYYRSDGTLDTATDPASNPTYQTSDFRNLLSS